MNPRAFALFSLLALLTTTSCTQRQTQAQAPIASPAHNSAALLTFLDDVYAAELARDPVAQHYQGITDRQSEWSDLSDAHADRELVIANGALSHMKAVFSSDLLDKQGQLNYALFQHAVEQRNVGSTWRRHSYPVTQMHGTHAWIPSFLINVHRIKSVDDADAYIARLRGIAPLMAQVIEQLKASEEAGVLPPAFVFPMVLNDCRNLLKGQPFEGEAPSPWLTDFTEKLDDIESLPEAERERLLTEAKKALVEQVQPAYTALIATLEDQATRATTDDGVWKLPDGAAYYAWRLKRSTTTDLSAEEIHQIGLDEVDRIHQEMTLIKDQLGFEGDLSAFFNHLRADPAQTYPNTPEGRQQYLQEATRLIDTMEAALPSAFHTLPKAPLQVKAVEAYREESAGKAFYSRGTPDGSRPGVYYANLYDMASMPKYQMEALAYHEGIPGHHMQNSISQELEGLAQFRKYGGHTAYGEGWGLYSEYLPKEMGFYTDPHADFGRLAMELWRACRLVVDTGIHHKRWTRQEAIDYLLTTTPNPERDVVKAIERYIIMPGQATAYKIGMLRILSLRAQAKATLGEAFDIRDFHEVILGNGSMPLEVLEAQVNEWIQTTLNEAP